MKHLIEKKNEKSIRSIAYFSMEVGLNEKFSSYSGGLGILAGDSIKTFADLIVPVVAVTLVSSKGYFRQNIVEGKQIENTDEWHPEQYLRIAKEKVCVEIDGRKVFIKAWEYDVEGLQGFSVPLYLLDTDLEENSPEDRRITDRLYGGDKDYRIKQEIVLGIGGVKILDALGYNEIKKYHMNEGHAAFLVLELLKRYNPVEVKKRCVFTTHTPVPAGHDTFEIEKVKEILGSGYEIKDSFIYEGKVNMTIIGLNHSEYINGVALMHREISRSMFPGYPIDSITNGVHSMTWTCPEFRQLYDKHIPGWKIDPFNLRYALSISRKEIWDSHLAVKKRMIDHINSLDNYGFDPSVFTIGFARRSTPYKRLDLFFHDSEKLMDIWKHVGEFQVVIAGKAHPNDQDGKDMIHKINDIIKCFFGKIKIVYLENYNIELGKLLTSGTDLWLNTPRRPMEASGTSGMKAAHNGIPQLSVLDGWWVEGHIENVTGWSIGKKYRKGEELHPDVDDLDAEELYLKLRETIIPMFYKDWDKWTEVMRHAIAYNASFFNTHRMVHQYVLNSYFD
jgi:starch phosphorylase